MNQPIISVKQSDVPGKDLSALSHNPSLIRIPPLNNMLPEIKKIMRATFFLDAIVAGAIQ